MKKRDRRQTPIRASLTAGWADAVPESTEVKPDTAQCCAQLALITASAFYLDGEGTSRNLESKEDKSKDTARIMSKQLSETKKKELKEERKRTKNNYRVPVLNPDGTPAMPTTSRRANKWIKEKKAKIVKNKLGIFQIQLLFEPSGRKKQPIVMTVDPGSAFTGIGVISKKSVLYGCTLELPGYKQGSKPKIVVNRFGKKVEKYANAIVEGMDKRRELRRGRRHRNCRRREERWLNRSKTKIAPSILARKQLELKVATILAKIYPIIMICFEDVAFDHFKDTKGVKGQFFSHVEVGKNSILNRLRKIAPRGVRIIKGYDTARMRIYLGMKKEGDKTVRSVEAHVNDCIAMGAMMFKGGVETKNKFKYDTITRPKYSRRILHLEQPGKGGFRRRYGGTTCIDKWTNIRKGDYVEARQGKKIFRSYVSGFTTMNGRNYIYVSDFDWKGFGKDRTQTAIVPSNIKILSRNSGLLVRSMVKIMTKDELFDNKTGTVQMNVEDAWG